LMAAVVARRQRGESFRTIGEALGVPEATCRRAAKGYARAGRPERPLKQAPAAPPDPPANESEEVAPSDPVDLDTAITEVKRAADEAKRAGNLTAYAALLQRYVALLEHQRKVAPPPKVDHNDNPDFAAAKERARAALHRLVDHDLIGNVRS